MQNNFERNVQQKMDGLKLTPSATVWERVEMEIKPEKKKRRGIFWFLFVGLLFGGVWLLQQSAEDNIKEAIQPHRETTITATDSVIDKKSKNAGKVSLQLKTPPTKNISRLDKETKPAENSPFVVKRKASFEEQPALVMMKTSSNKKTETPLVVGIAKSDAAPIENKKMKVAATVDSTSEQTITTQTTLNNTDSVKTKKEEKETLPSGIDSTGKNSDSVLKKKVASASKWRKRLSFGAGISGYAEGPFFQSFNSNRNALYISALSSPGAPVAVAAQPSPTKSGFAFSLGFSMVKNMGKRWELSIGLQYAYESTHQKVGDKKATDTTVQFAMDKSTASGFYTNTGTDDYTARFHFIELPVTLSFKPSLRVPLSVSVGAAYGRLLYTNALTFSSASNLYYQNKENYLRNALNVSSSVQIDVLAKKKLLLRSGPYVQYNTIKLRKEASNITPHLLTAGIKTVIIF